MMRVVQMELTLLVVDYVPMNPAISAPHHVMLNLLLP